MATQSLEDKGQKNALMIKSFLLTFLLLSLSSFSNDNKPPVTNENLDEIQVESETLNFFNQEKKRMAIFEGNVHVTRNEMTMTSNKMTCFLNSRNEIHLIIAEGNVIITQGDTKAKSEKVAYSPDEKKIILIKNPVVYMKESTIHARRITIYQQTNDIFFDEPVMQTIIKDEQVK